MPNEVTDAIRKYLPPESINVLPLEFEWAEADNAILFTSNFTKSTFEDWDEALTEHYNRIAQELLGIPADDEPHPDLGCVSYWMPLTPSPLVDVHVAWLPSPESLENLNAWIGSSRLEEMVASDSPQTAGLVRFRPLRPRE